MYRGGTSGVAKTTQATWSRRAGLVFDRVGDGLGGASDVGGESPARTGVGHLDAEDDEPSRQTPDRGSEAHGVDHPEGVATRGP